LLIPAAVGAQATQQAAWLDQPPRPWNTPGAAVPAAPRPDVPFQAICRAQERAPAGRDEEQLVAAGWLLEQYWPTQRRGDEVVVVATSSYDGMCRPWAYNGFVFAGGRYAGTVSPTEMSSRTDGALAQGPAFLADGRIGAAFVRYAPTDPLCCPSRGNTGVVYAVQTTNAGPVVVPVQIGPGAGVGGQLPRTGGAPLPAGGLAGYENERQGAGTMGLIGGIARTAVAAGTWTAVSNGVSRRQAGRWAEQDRSHLQQPYMPPPPGRYQRPMFQPPARQYQQAPAYQAPPQYQQAPVYQPPASAPQATATEPAPPAAAPAADDMSQKLAMLQQLAGLKAQGILTEEEFEAQKAKLLAS
jgi:hypothetical protein